MRGAPRRARSQALAGPGVAGPGRGLGARGLPLPGTWAGPAALGSSFWRWPLPALGFFLWARVGRRLHHRDITSIQALIGLPVLQVCAIRLHSNKARQALPPPTHLQARARRTFRPGRELGVSGGAGLSVVAVYCHAPARGRAHSRALTRTHFQDFGFPSGKRFGVQPSTRCRRALPPRMSQRAHTNTRRGHLGVSHLTFVTFVLALP